MSIRSKFAYGFAGFMGGIAFLISCSDGSGRNSISEVEAAVAIDQMYCEGESSLWNGTSSGTPNVGPALVCYDTGGTGRTISIADAYAEGWRIQLVASLGDGSSSPFPARYVFEM